MKITAMDVSTLKDRTLGEESAIVLETSRGRFRVTENADGSLTLGETSHFNLAVALKSSNSMVLHAINPAGHPGGPSINPSNQRDADGPLDKPQGIKPLTGHPFDCP